MKNFFSLLFTRFAVSLKNFVEGCKVMYRYYPNAAFRRTDLALLRQYLWRNPFRISKEFLQASGASDVYAYGETPLTTLDLIAKNCGITAEDRVVELGCGRGRTCFWLNSFLKCPVRGIDFVPEFIEKARQVKERFHLDNIEFECVDFLHVDIREATLIYLYGTTLDEKSIKALIAKIEPGIKIITVSYPLTDYSARFKLIKSFSAPFTWGTAEVYLQQSL